MCHCRCCSFGPKVSSTAVAEGFDSDYYLA